MSATKSEVTFVKFKTTEKYEDNHCHYAAVGFVALLSLYLTGYEREGVGDDGQVVTDKAAYAVTVGHGKLDEVPECPCHGVAASLERSFLSLCRAHDTRCV